MVAKEIKAIIADFCRDARSRVPTEAWLRG